jgi:hypothetical protein
MPEYENSHTDGIHRQYPYDTHGTMGPTTSVNRIGSSYYIIIIVVSVGASSTVGGVVFRHHHSNAF